MYNYRGKIRAIVIIVAALLLMAVAVSFCLWDDTSIKNLKATGGTSNYKGTDPALGVRLTIDGIKYTVGYKGTVGAKSFVTLYSDDVSSKGVTKVYDAGAYNNYNYDGRVLGTINPGGVKSQIFTSTQNYYATLASKAVTYNGVTYGKVSDYIIPHLDYGWNLWQPSVRELTGSTGAHSDLEGSLQPVMRYYDSKSRLQEYNNTSYWLRTPHKYSSSSAYFIIANGSCEFQGVNVGERVARVALNLRI